MTLLNKARAVRAALMGPLAEAPECKLAGDSDHGVAASFVETTCNAYAERIAIVMEAGDISESEARRIAEAEIGAAFVDQFIEGS